jgi:hypothetical protein
MANEPLAVIVATPVVETVTTSGLEEAEHPAALVTVTL